MLKHIKIYSALIILLTATILSGSGVNQKAIHGKVVDEATKEALIGANIFIKESNIGTASNHNGYFILKGFELADFELSVSMLGYKTETLKITEQNFNYDTLYINLRQGMIEMGSIVVTGTNTAHLYENVPVKTEIIPNALILKKKSLNLAEALSFQTGLSVDNECNNCNFTQVRILGFDGKYSQILIDGDPVMSTLGGVYGLEHFPKEMIEQIEVVKGGGSALYGSGAISGTINLMTKRPAFNSTKINYLGQSADGSYDQQLGAVAELVSDDGLTGAFIFGSTRSRNPYDRNLDGYTEIGELKNETIGFNFFHRPSNKTEVNLSLHRIHEERRGGSELEKPIHESRIGEWTEHFRWGGKIGWMHRINNKIDYKVNYSFSILERDSYYGGLAENTPEGRLKALNFYGYSNNPLHSGGIQGNYRFSNQVITAGFQYFRDELLDRSVANESYYVDEVFENAGFFLQDEIFFGSSNQFTIIAGARVDKHSAIQNWIVSPRLNLMYKFDNGLIVRAGYSTGFKAPQIFDEDLHICGLEGDQRVIRNSNYLKEERSHTFTIGTEYQDFIGKTPLLIGITGFYTRLDGAYSEQFVSREDKFEVWERINSTGAYVTGIELDLGVKPFSSIEFRSGLTYKKNKYDEKLEDFNTRNFLRTPDLFGHFNVIYDVTKNLGIFTAVKYQGKMNVPHEILIEGNDEPLLKLERVPSFVELDFGITYNLQLINNFSTKLSVGVKNLTDAYQGDLDYGLNRDPGYVYGPANPRTMYFSIETSF